MYTIVYFLAKCSMLFVTRNEWIYSGTAQYETRKDGNGRTSQRPACHSEVS